MRVKSNEQVAKGLREILRRRRYDVVETDGVSAAFPRRFCPSAGSVVRIVAEEVDFDEATKIQAGLSSSRIVARPS